MMNTGKRKWDFDPQDGSMLEKQVLKQLSCMSGERSYAANLHRQTIGSGKPTPWAGVGD